MSLQQLFDDVVAHARTQRKISNKAIRIDHIDTTMCQYRSADGLKCFIGALIPDDLYQASFEDQCVEEILRMSKELKSYFKTKYDLMECTFIIATRHLQIIHDCSPVSDWDESFAAFAEREKLQYPPQEITEAINKGDLVVNKESVNSYSSVMQFDRILDGLVRVIPIIDGELYTTASYFELDDIRLATPEEITEGRRL